MNALLALAAALAVGTAHAQVKCTAADGSVTYQQRPCPGGKPVDTSGAGRADPASPGAMQARREVAAARDWEAVSAGRVGPGMTAAQAAQAWGDPRHVNRTVTRHGVREQWVYGGRNYIYVENGVVTAVQSGR